VHAVRVRAAAHSARCQRRASTAEVNGRGSAVRAAMGSACCGATTRDSRCAQQRASPAEISVACPRYQLQICRDNDGAVRRCNSVQIIKHRCNR
jgi:hypothetical protein